MTILLFLYNYLWLTKNEFGTTIETIKQRSDQMKTLMVFVLGIIVGTIGLGGTLRALDHGVSKVQEVAKESAK